MTSKSAQPAGDTPPLSPTASFYDLSDDEEGEYNTIMHSSSGKGVRLLFSKSKVRVAAFLSTVENSLRFIAGLSTPYTILERQHSGLRSSHTAKTQW